MAGKIREYISRRRLKKLAKKGKVSYKGDKVKAKAYDREATKQQRETLPGSEKAGKVSRKAVGAERTKGGSYAKYKKGGKESRSFDDAFKNACGGGKGGTFDWQGRSYSCKSGSSKAKPETSKIVKAGLKAGLIKYKK